MSEDHTPGESFEFIIEKDKIEKIRTVVSHNGGEVLSENVMDDAVRIKVGKHRAPGAQGVGLGTPT